MSEFTDGLTEEGANKLADLVITRLPMNGFSLISAALEVLEIPVPDEMNKDEFITQLKDN